jgi:hypothetical protein
VSPPQSYFFVTQNSSEAIDKVLWSRTRERPMASMAFQIPQPCPFCGTLMSMTNQGVRCEKCEHEVFNMGEKLVCECQRCAANKATS